MSLARPHIGAGRPCGDRRVTKDSAVISSVICQRPADGCWPRHDDSGTFTGLASVFDNLDYDGLLFVKLPSAGHSVAAHADTAGAESENADDPRCYVGDVAEATETDDGLAIKCRFDLDTEFGGERFTPTLAAC